MLPTQRRQAILAEVRQARAVSAEDLARRFGVSLETIRRDLRGLRDRGLLERVYGGALSIRSTEGDFATRSTLHSDRKLAIAQLAASLIGPRGHHRHRCRHHRAGGGKGAAPYVPRPGADQLGTRRDGPRRPGRDRDPALRRAAAARRRGLLRLARGGLLRRVLRGQGVPRLRRRARPGRAHRLPPARGDHPADHHRAVRRVLRAGRFQQARHHRRTQGLPAQPRHRRPHRCQRQCRGHRSPRRRRLHGAESTVPKRPREGSPGGFGDGPPGPLGPQGGSGGMGPPQGGSGGMGPLRSGGVLGGRPPD